MIASEMQFCRCKKDTRFIMEQCVASAVSGRERRYVWRHSEDVPGSDSTMIMELVMDRQTMNPATADAKVLARYCFDDGLIILSCGERAYVIGPPMPSVIDSDQLERGLAVITEGLPNLEARNELP